ncbi:hypothetical protein PC116_g22922 [Phytophthora cactorum]|nr:hypothetical protein PC111_g20072 [Phytophthora cactorum]KAG4228736.1 hypothetical protein PC116_g22922 [Phytophthora cactorum]
MRRLPLAVGAVLLVCDTAAAACARGVHNSKICSGHGTCNTRNLCECDAKHFGFDCSQKRCPLGPAWVAPARATDDAHYLVECSNKGVCDHEEGKCTCDEGFIGSACQRMGCASGCNDVGQCMSLKELSAIKGYHGYDCSLKSCPRGDDPMTNGQKNEVQIVQCTGTGGSFFLFFKGQEAEIPFDATLNDLEKILTTIKTLPVVKVAFGGTAITVCSSTTANPIMIEFIQDFGPQSPIKVLGTLRGVVYLKGGSVFATSAGGILGGRTSVQGTKEWEFCSNRGDCNFETGQCKCFTNPMPGYRSSDGYGNPADTATVPVRRLTGAFASKDGRLEIVRRENVRQAHHGSPLRHQCSCYTPFEGAACEYMKCSGYPACSGHGQCMTIRQLSLEADADSESVVFDYGTDPNNIKTFDRDNVLGCKCDPGYEGYDCSKRSCLKGDDPVTTDQVDEIQLLKCTATGGVFRLQYRTITSVDIPFDATLDVLRDTLMNSFGFDDPAVEYSSGTKACSAPGSTDNIITVAFPIDHGDIPPLRAVTTDLTASSGTVSFVTADNGVAIGGVVSQKGTKENAVCSNRGYCDYSQGICSCSIGYGTSDGRGNQGNRGDCGRIMPKVKYVAQDLPTQ